MGKIISFRYSVQFTGKALFTPVAWKPKFHGKPSNVNLSRYMESLISSCLPGGVNQHLGDPQITTARIVDHNTDTVVASWGE